LSKPTKDDAQLLLQLEQMLLMEPNQRAFHWFWRVFYPRKISDISKIREIYPNISEGSMYLDRLAAFWESAGALVNNGLMNEQLFFDRFLVKPYWDALKVVIAADREETKEPRNGENFELLAKREEAWRERTPPK